MDYLRENDEYYFVNDRRKYNVVKGKRGQSYMLHLNGDCSNIIYIDFATMNEFNEYWKSTKRECYEYLVNAYRTKSEIYQKFLDHVAVLEELEQHHNVDAEKELKDMLENKQKKI